MSLIDLSGATLQRRITAPSLAFQNYVTVEEDPNDDAEITRHPVDSGAIMSDHIFLMPPELKLRLGWSNSDPASTGATYVRDIYGQLLQLKNNRQLFTVYTGKRFYNNMFVASLRGPVTDHRHEWSMIVDLMLRQVLLVNLATPSNKPTSVNAAANPANQNLADPTKNQPTQNTGVAQLTTGNGPTQIPSGESATIGPDGFTGLQTGTGPTQVPSGLDGGGYTNTQGGGANDLATFGSSM